MKGVTIGDSLAYKFYDGSKNFVVILTLSKLQVFRKAKKEFSEAVKVSRSLFYFWGKVNKVKEVSSLCSLGEVKGQMFGIH